MLDGGSRNQCLRASAREESPSSIRWRYRPALRGDGEIPERTSLLSRAAKIAFWPWESMRVKILHRGFGPQASRVKAPLWLVQPVLAWGASSLATDRTGALTVHRRPDKTSGGE